MFMVVLLTFAPGCGWFGAEPEPESENDDTVTEPDPVPEPTQSLVEEDNESGDGYFYRSTDLPTPIQEWVDNAANDLFLGQSRVFGEYLYILVTYGPQPTGGFVVEITEVQVRPETVDVQVVFSKPDPGEAVTQAISYPYDLVLIPAVDLPVVFNPRGAEQYLMTLYGVDYLEPITASSAGIKLFEPSKNVTVQNTLRFRGVASVFEGTILYRLTGEDGAIIEEGFANAGMGEWHYFEGVIPLDGLIQDALPAVLELFTISPKDGTEQDIIFVPLTLSP